MSTKESKKLFSPAEVASRLGVSPVTVRSWASKGWLNPQITPGGHRRYLWEDVERLLLDHPVQTASSHAHRILLVDDDTQFRSYLADALSALAPEAEIMLAADGFQAGMVMVDFRPDLIFLDYVMPGLDGAAICRQIRSDSRFTGTRIFAVTGYSGQAIEHDLLTAGADKVLLKPLPIATLMEILAQCCPQLLADPQTRPGK